MPQSERPKPSLARSSIRSGSKGTAVPSASGAVNEILGLQGTLGNDVVQRLLRARVLGPDSRLSQPSDSCELEADRVSHEVVAAPDAQALLQDGESVPPAASDAAPAGGQQAAAREALGSGQPLDSATRAFMEQRFGRSFEAVRIHTGPGPETAAAALRARAFTIGADIVFGRGSYDPQGGRTLLAHELAHVAQQGHSGRLGSTGGLTALTGAGPGLSDAATGATVLRQSATSAPTSVPTTPPPPNVLQEITTYTALARRIYRAVTGLGTDEEAVYAALREVGRDRARLDLLEAAYLGAYGESLEDAIRDDFSGDELDLALQLMSATAMELRARRVRTAVEGAGTDEDAIYSALGDLGRNQAQIDSLKATYFGFYGEDMVARIVSETSGEEKNFALHLLRPPGATASAVTAEGEGMVGLPMRWAPSGPGGKTDFERWASAPTEAAAPVPSDSTVMNCWEAILLMAHRQGTLRWKWIHDLYVSKQSDWFDFLVNQLSPLGRVDYKPSDATPRVPVRGDIVFFNGAAHVALATGARDGQGRTVVLSFWPPPDVVPYTSGTLDQVKLTTIEELVTFMAARDWNHDVQFATPPW